MKNHIIYLAIFLFGITVVTNAQENNDTKQEFKTILGGKSSVGGYGAIGIGFTEIDPKDGAMLNARAGVVLNHWVSLGIAGTGFISDVFSESDNQINPAELNIAGGYGGIFFEPIIFPFSPIHISIPLFAGVGGATVIENLEDIISDDVGYIDNYVSTGFLVFEPGVELELNVTRFFRLAFGGYYRMTSQVDLPGYGLSKYPLDGFSAGLTFKFGLF